MDIEFIIFQSDSLTLPFAIIFHIAAILNVIYGAHEKHWNQHVAIMSYSGAAIAKVHAGDLFTLLYGGKLQLLLQFFLILASKTKDLINQHLDTF